MVYSLVGSVSSLSVAGRALFPSLHLLKVETGGR